MTTRWILATRSVMPRSTSATALVMHTLAMTHRDHEPAPEAAPAHAARSRRFVRAAPRVGRRPRHLPRSSRSQTQAASGDTVVVVVAPGAPVVAVLPSPWKSFPRTSTISVPASDESSTSWAPGTMLGEQLGLGQVGRRVADLAVVDGAARGRSRRRRSRTPSAGAPARWCRRRPARRSRCAPATRTSTGRTAGVVPPPPLVAGGAVVVVGIGASPRRTASTASASGCFSTRNEPAESPIFHGRVSKVGPLPSSSERPMNARTSSLNDAAVERLVGGEVAGSGGRRGRVRSIGSSVAFSTAMRPSRLMKSCWRSMRSMSARPLASTHLPFS